ncbi:MAG: 3-oxoacyl-ACP reductase FabG [Methylococcales bacterium]
MTDKVALVTGASRGIGQAIARRLAGDGNIVIGTATSEQGAEAISDYLLSENYRGKGMVLDVTRQESISALIDSIKDEFGIPGILVNNAGITRDNLLMRMKDEEWDDIINTNLGSIFRLSKACLRGMMKSRWGRIVNITSVVAAVGNAGQCNYTAAKAGAIGFTKSMAKEVSSRGITVNAVSPGFIDTDMTRSLPDEQKTALLSAIPLNRLGSPEDIAHATAFLCSDEAAYITGETLNVNGGMYMA